MARGPDIAEVARHARVSKSTVSRVINGGYASAEVRARVAKVIQKLGYTPWTTARNFSLGRAGCFGLVVFDTQSEWVTQILGGIEEELTSRHISLLVGSLFLRTDGGARLFPDEESGKELPDPACGDGVRRHADQTLA